MERGNISDFEEFRNRLNKLITDSGLTPRTFAIKAGLSIPTINRYVNGLRTPEIQVLYQIAQYFNVSIDWLLGIAQEVPDSLSPELSNVVKLYRRATQEDKMIINAILRHYDSDT